MYHVDLEWFQIAIGWGCVSAIMTWQVLQWAHLLGSNDRTD